MESESNRLSVAIVGGGPAGCATALSLLNTSLILKLNLQITLYNASVKTSPSVGETVPPVLSQYLRELNIEHVLEENHHLPCPGSISVWQDETPGYNDFLFTPIGKGYHLNRKFFNQQLLQACIKKGVRVLSDTRVGSINQYNNGYLLSVEHKSVQRNVYCDFVIDATGYHRTIINKLNIAQNTLDKVISLCAFFDLGDSKTQAANTLVCSAADGWWYGTQLPKKRALISFCTDSQGMKNTQSTSPKIWFQYLKMSEWFYRQCMVQFGTELPLPNKLWLRPCSSDILSNVVGQNWLAVGDAASSYDSISSAGITKSILQGICAGKSIGMAFHKQSLQPLFNYQDRVFDDFRHFVRQHQTQYTAGGARFNHSGFWQRRNIISLFDDSDRHISSTESL
ncbi:tryptophan 7-halogenase [Alteromonas sp. D210916BOD_24]|uniref:NAD(P)/FAD-dependent oxidoreductase n=1 Tax=Alteromonas sp. D210916BOD_24 TaxID=3157618 RepID=UPI00399D2AA6